MLKREDVMVTSSQGERVEATLARCGVCGDDASIDPLFMVFQIKGQDHIHLQCHACGSSYCAHGKCG